MNVVKEETMIQLTGIPQDIGMDIAKCYQCGKCSAGCPVGFAMDYTPRAILRMLQLNMAEDAIKTNTIWICASCQTCSVRCPRGVDIASVMESLRIRAKEEGHISEKEIDLFHDLFLKSIEKYGRAHEMGIILSSNLLGKKPFKDVEYGVTMLSKGKLRLLPHTIKENEQVKRIFENVRKRGSKR
jgi:heterodisulfide reductase subunit C